MQDGRASYLVTWLFATSAERIIAYGRIALAASALGAFVLHYEGTADGETLTLVLLVGYFVHALAIIVFGLLWPISDGLQQVTHGLDIAAASALLFLTHGPASPYFVVCIFVLVAGALRWNWRGPIISASILGAVLVASYLSGLNGDDPEELNQFIVRLAFLAVGGMMLSYAAARRQRTRTRLAALAKWPAATPEPGPASLAPALAHAAEVLSVNAVLVAWEQREEPFLHMLSWQNGTVRYSREQRKLFGDLVAGRLGKRSMIIGDARAEPGKPPLINQELQKTFQIENAATAQFSGETCKGRVFLINRPSWTEEELALTEIVAGRIGNEIEELLLREQVQQTASVRERERLGRDLHDGLLQGLAAATMQLRATADGLPEPNKKELDSIRSIISDEAQKIRRFVEETRARPALATGVVELAPEVMSVIENSRRRWACEVELSITPPDLQCSLSAARSIRHMLNEAISNAVRHGRASRVEADITHRDDRLVLSIQDDGRGFVDLDGSYTQKQLKMGNRGPLSLRSRVEELGGVLYLTSTPTGSNITVEFPR